MITRSALPPPSWQAVVAATGLSVVAAAALGGLARQSGGTSALTRLAPFDAAGLEIVSPPGGGTRIAAWLPCG